MYEILRQLCGIELPFVLPGFLVGHAYVAKPWAASELSVGR